MLAVTYCPTCAIALDEESGVCPRCGQTYCPECGAPVGAEDVQCGRCGTEFAVFCSACEKEVPPSATICPHCQASLNEEADEIVQAAGSPQIELILPARHSGTCPNCGAPVFLEDGFCSQCGVMLCSNCGLLVGEEADICPHCHTALFFPCPLCAFELITGSDQCPNCNALIPNYCTHCQAELPRQAQICPACAEPVRVLQRNGARIIHSLRLGEQVVQVAACPNCGSHFPVHEEECHSCGHRICSRCQISMQPDEIVCPRCGPRGAQRVYAPPKQRACNNCGQPLQPLEDECTQCGQLYCPECLQPIGDEDATCAACGTEFEFECPRCGRAVSAADDFCPHCGAEF